MSLLFCTISAVLRFLQIRHVHDSFESQDPTPPPVFSRETIPYDVLSSRRDQELLAQITRRVGARRPGQSESAPFEQLTIPIDSIRVAMNRGWI